MNDLDIADELARLTLELRRIPSETGDEARIADWVEARCRSVAGPGATHRIGHSVVCDPYAGDPAAPATTVALELPTTRTAICNVLT